MAEREEGFKQTDHKRINLYVSIERYSRLDKISQGQDLNPTGVVNRFTSLGLRVWDEAQAEDFEGVYIKKGGEFIKLPFMI